MEWEAPIAYRYQWQRCDSRGVACADVAEANGAAYQLGPEDAAKRMRALVTGSNTYGSGVARSVPTEAVELSPPRNASAPTIDGGASMGSSLAVLQGSWWGTGPLLYAYQWRRCDRHGGRCRPIDGAIHASYETAADDVGSTLRVSVTAANDQGDATVMTAATDAIAR